MDDKFDFVHEIPDKYEWLDIHISLLFNELKDIRIAVYIFNTVDEEWDKRVQEKAVPNYSIVRTTLYEALVYRVFLGLNKIFSDSKEYSLRKATNQIEQIYHDNQNIAEVITEIRKKLDDSLMIRIIRAYRDKFFAHLDKKSAMSYVRIEPSSEMKRINENELDEWLLLTQKLYQVCFIGELSCELDMPPKEDIIYTFLAVTYISI